jgi:hypothetical protein
MISKLVDLGLKTALGVTVAYGVTRALANRQYGRSLPGGRGKIYSEGQR